VRNQRPFIALWTVAVAATVAAFVLHLALRGKNVQMGYALGKARTEQAALREVKRVLELEAASYETPQRVEVVARTLLGMQAPSADRIIPIGGLYVSAQDVQTGAAKSAAAASSAGAPPANAKLPVASARADR